ncbi:MAG TPA: divalent metal cation transporter [Chthonomonadaceae bacterium]|nr:divalent metal cation transporter [Chthonomonadaceae bacterium]
MLGRPIDRARGRSLLTRLRFILAVVGPGIIAANADNDASGIYGYALAGAQYKYAMLWVLVLVTISLGVCQEMGARMGAITGKGLADLIREEYGVKITFFAMGVLLIANYCTTVSEFAGITAAVEIFTTPATRLLVRWAIVWTVAIGIWLLVTRTDYRRVERVLLYASAIYLAYVASAFMAHPPWQGVLRQTVWPDLRALHVNQAYVLMVINLIGTTITPWGQFYIQSSVRDKSIRPEEYPITRADVLFGAFFTNLIAFFIIVCCGATLFPSTADRFNDAGEIALALRPIAGSLATLLFAFGLFNASCFGAITVPLSTAYAITESLGSESGVGRRAREAPLFVGILAFLLVVSALTVLFGGRNLAFLIILPNIVGGILLPIILILTLRLINNRRVMQAYANSRIYNLIAWVTTVTIIALTLVLLVQQILQWIK